MEYITKKQPDEMMQMIRCVKRERGNFYAHESDWYVGMSVTKKGVYIRQTETYEELKKWMLGRKTESDRVQ